MLISVFYHNKCQFIALLKDQFLSDGHQVYVCKGNVDTTIVSKSLEESKRCPVDVVADDTDVAVMLCYHWSKKQHKEVLFYQERKMPNAGAYKTVSELGDMKDHLLFIHAWSGCDTTSSIMNKGKSSFFKLVQKSSVLKAASEVMIGRE